MSEVIPQCVNHPGAETRLSCTTCGDPICTRCMKQGAVGQKCPSCARQPRSARARGKPADYVRIAVVGPATAIGGGIAYGLLLGALPFGSLILAGILGFLIGKAVRWAARGQTQQPFLGLAVGLGVCAIAVGLVFVGVGLLPRGLFGILAYAASGWFAARGLQN